MTRPRLYWRLCYGAALLISGLTFTPLVIPIGTYQPTLAGLPYTLWVGLLITVVLVVLTYFATELYPVRNPQEDNTQ